MNAAACILKMQNDGNKIVSDKENMMQNINKWSHDWENFDWSAVKQKLEELRKKEGDENRDYDVGISREEFLEYLEWLEQTDKEGYSKAVLSIKLGEMGFSESRIEELIKHPDETLRIIQDIYEQ